jgi:hypothetical protein
MRNAAEICNLWPSDAELARDIDVPYSTVAAWKQRGSIPASYWRDLVLAAKARRIGGVTADVLADLHARTIPASNNGGFDERETPPFVPTLRRDPEEDTGHFSRFRHLQRSTFASSEEIVEHIRALREEWDRR